ncbi:L,D-transpeptidase Cds6 family protein [Ramlibacter sp.]|uniref:L,D-transpeptidase Cds6 family protein n=1 Tax=Ramlibacter sp. TaxID=1917967 RepID=UPI003D14B16D
MIARRTPLFAAALCCLPLLSWADAYGNVDALLRAGKTQEALAQAEQHLAGNPRDPRMRLLKGVALTESSRTGEAMTVFLALTEDYPELPEPHNNLGVLYAGQEQLDRARASLELAVRSSSKYSTALENLGDVHARLAGEAYARAAGLDANNHRVRPKLALLRDLVAAPGMPAAALSSAPAFGIAVSQAPIHMTASPATAATAATAPDAPAAAPTPARMTAETSQTSLPDARTPDPMSMAQAPVFVRVVSDPPRAATPIPRNAKPATERLALASVSTRSSRPGQPAQSPDSAQLGQSSSETRGVEDALAQWASAWSLRDMEGYFSSYSADFRPAGLASRKAWEEQRRQRILGKSRIAVNVSDVSVELNGATAIVKFRQNYAADGLVLTDLKTLEMARDGQRWRITRETTGG